MNKLQLLSLLFLSLGISSCSSDDDNNESNKNQLVYMETEYELKAGNIEPFGEWEPNTYNFDLTLYTTEVTPVNGFYEAQDDEFISVFFEMLTDNPTELKLGTYESHITADEITAGTFGTGAIFNSSNNDYVYITEGTVEVLQNGPTYEFVIDCVTAEGETVSGHYEGTLYTNANSDRTADNVEQSSKKIIWTKKK